MHAGVQIILFAAEGKSTDARNVHHRGSFFDLPLFRIFFLGGGANLTVIDPPSPADSSSAAALAPPNPDGVRWLSESKTFGNYILIYI